MYAQKERENAARDHLPLLRSHQVAVLVEQNRLGHDLQGKRRDAQRKAGDGERVNEQKKAVDDPHKLSSLPQWTRASSSSVSSSKLTPCTWTLTSTTVSPVMFSIAFLTFSCTAMATSGTRAPYFTIM